MSKMEKGGSTVLKVRIQRPQPCPSASTSFRTIQAFGELARTALLSVCSDEKRPKKATVHTLLTGSKLPFVLASSSYTSGNPEVSEITTRNSLCLEC